MQLAYQVIQTEAYWKEVHGDAVKVMPVIIQYDARYCNAKHTLEHNTADFTFMFWKDLCKEFVELRGLLPVDYCSAGIEHLVGKVLAALEVAHAWTEQTAGLDAATVDAAKQTCCSMMSVAPSRAEFGILSLHFEKLASKIGASRVRNEVVELAVACAQDPSAERAKALSDARGLLAGANMAGHCVEICQSVHDFLTHTSKGAVEQWPNDLLKTAFDCYAFLSTSAELAIEARTVGLQYYILRMMRSSEAITSMCATREAILVHPEFMSKVSECRRWHTAAGNLVANVTPEDPILGDCGVTSDSVCEVGTLLGELANQKLELVDAEVNTAREELCDLCHLDRANFAYLWSHAGLVDFAGLRQETMKTILKPGSPVTVSSIKNGVNTMSQALV